MIEMITMYAAMWAPALVAVFGTIFGVLKGVLTLKNALGDVRNTSEFKELASQLKAANEENARLNRSVRLLTDKIAHIEGYSDTKLSDTKKEG